ncbi:GNAT family N-acetyltransferase [Clostridium thermarum]|uniref:GNAT family N-acetyltransferase n=1 Tax=Clostridium thermarum TaxID=1716543 RepID=UPI001122C5F9|nr:GNAT family N-acetyltransferase [Clostridium thermarum]
MVIKFVDYDEQYCDLSWAWLNDEELRKLTLTPYFTRESQKGWFHSLKDRTDYQIWGIECDNKPIGAVGIKNIREGKEAEYFGYIGEKDYWFKGIGREMMEFILRKARDLGLNFLYLKVGKYNERAIKLYQKSGFQIYDDNEEILHMIRQIR